MPPKLDKKETLEDTSGKNTNKESERPSVERASLPFSARTIVIHREIPAERCPNCGMNVIPILEYRKNTCVRVTALVLCLLCLWPCACCIYCSPCGILVYHICPICAKAIRVQRLS